MSAEMLGIFVKSPRAGLVKTRLAESIGAHDAAALYRSMGRQIVARCLDPGRHRTTIWLTPAEEEPNVRAWLLRLEVDEFRVQREAGLDVRLSAAFAHHFAEGATRVVVIGSDCPDVDTTLVRRAFDALRECDLVIGPARDGGYYLIGLRFPTPELFRRVTWSTDLVFRQTMLNAARLGLSATVLPELRDVDTVADARALDLLPTVGCGTDADDI
jgi:rSAM/selenodomain-associated transferase 1